MSNDRDQAGAKSTIPIGPSFPISTKSGTRVRISQVVRALDDSIVSEGVFVHTHQIEDTLIVLMASQEVATAACAVGLEATR